MLNRRIFFKHAGAFALGTLIFPACNSQREKSGAEANADSTKTTTPEEGKALGAIGLQLYSVKDVLDEDLKGTLQKLSEMGYKEVESYPGVGGHYYGMEPEEFVALLKELDMELVSSHFGSGERSGSAESWRDATMLHKFDELVDKAAATGQKYLTCSWMDESLRQTADDLKKTAELFNKTGEKCKEAGLQFAYHNHAFEFETIGDVMIYDYLLENTDQDLVKYELDIYWVAAAKKDPVTYFKKYPGRFPLCHVKDMGKQDPTKNAVLGEGSLDFKKILGAASQAGMDHYLVEQETFTGSSLEAMKENYNFLSKIRI